MAKLRLNIVTICSIFFSLNAVANQTSFWVWDLTVMPPGFRKPTFEHKATAPLESSSAHLWVEEGLKEHAPSAETLEALTSLLPRVITTQHRYFGRQGASPSGDMDIHVLIAALPPYEKNGRKFGFDGFFNVFDQMTELEANRYEQHSNERNIVYLNALQDLSSPYMQGVLAHELNHLITHGQYDEQTNPLSPWLNESLGEAAMIMTGFYTDVRHVALYRAHPQWPLAVDGYGLSYGAAALFAEYLLLHFGPEAVGQIASTQGNAFTRVEKVTAKPWGELFTAYVRWLFEQSPPSGFGEQGIAVRPLDDELTLAPTGAVFVSPLVPETTKLEITAVPPTCNQSRNVLRKSVVTRAKDKQSVTAIWIESTPPCAATRGGTGFEQDAFKVTTKRNE